MLNSLKKNMVYFFLIFGTSLLFSEEVPIKCSFFSLESWQSEDKQLAGNLIEIRGFLYESKYGLILASEPNLKSCCVGGASRREKQLLVENFIDVPRNSAIAVTLKGTLLVDRNHEFPFRLKNVETVEDAGYGKLMLFLGIALMFMVGLQFILRNR